MMSLAHAFETIVPAGRLVPPAPPPPAKDLPLLHLMGLLRSNSLRAWPARAYRELIIHRRFFGVDCFLVSDPAAVRHVMVERAADYVRPISMQRLLQPFAGGGLLTSEGDTWRQQRRMLAPAFTPQSVDRLVPHFRDAGAAMALRLGQGGRTNLAMVLEETAIDAVGRAMFSMPLIGRASQIGGLLREYFKGAARGSVWDFLAESHESHGWTLGQRRSWSRRWFAEIDRLVSTRRALPKTQDLPADVLDLLLAARDSQTGAPLSDKDIRDQVATMVATGFESTARTLFWAVYMLACDPEEQGRIRAEVTAAEPDGVNRLAGLTAWPRLTGVLNETMRLYPSVSTLTRMAKRPDEIGGAKVRPGNLVIVSPWVMHRHHRLWDQPDAFLPERFVEHPERMRDEAFIPFGVGRRICIGAAFATTEASLLLAQLIRHFEIRLDDMRPVLPIATATTIPSLEPWFRLAPVKG